MAQRVIIPRMGQTMTEGVIARWYKNDGDSVAAGEDVYELEYDKASAPVQAKISGTVKLLFEEGAIVPLGEAVAVILEEGEEFDESIVKGAHSVANAAKAGREEPEPAAPAVTAEKTVLQSKNAGLRATPMARRLAREKGVDIAAVPANEDGRITAQEVNAFGGEAAALPADSNLKNIRISPLARKMAKDRGIDISKIRPADGVRITKSDVLDYKAAPAPAAEWRGGKRVPLKGMRKVISERMTQSYFCYPSVTLTTDADMGELIKLRGQINEELKATGIKLSVTDMLVKAVAKALKENDIINTSLAENEIIFHDDINIGVAVALDEGLVVPVVKNADRLSLSEISNETKRLAGLARNGQIGADDMSGGTFSITNLGTEGIDAFNPIINYPESAILGVGRTVQKPVVKDGEIVIGQRAVLSLTHDHRVIDGVPAARFLQSVIRFIEKPFLLLMD